MVWVSRIFSTPRGWCYTLKSAWRAARSRAGIGAMATIFPCSKALPNITILMWKRRLKRYRNPSKPSFCTARAKKKSNSPTSWIRAILRERPFVKSTHLRAFCRIWNGVIGKPNRPRCGKNWRVCAVPALVPRATAAVCGWKHGTLKWEKVSKPALFTKSTAPRCARVWIILKPSPCTEQKARLPPKSCAKSACG